MLGAASTLTFVKVEQKTPFIDGGPNAVKKIDYCISLIFYGSRPQLSPLCSPNSTRKPTNFITFINCSTITSSPLKMTTTPLGLPATIIAIPSFPSGFCIKVICDFFPSKNKTQARLSRNSK